MRTARRVRLLAAAGAAVAALALTACQNGTGTRDEGASLPPSAATASTASTPGPSGTPGGDTGTGTATGGGGSSAAPVSGTATRTPKSSGNGNGGGSGSGSAAVLCNGSNTAVTVQPLSRPLNHMLITVRNTGTRTCHLTYYPVLRFDEMQWVPRPAEETHPQAVTTLAPGESGYAGVLLSAADGSGDGGTTGRRLTVAFQGTTPNSDGGASATPSLPAKGMYYDSSLQVTYWQQDRGDALDW
ncbi:DUF4232 domain-containing protein [Streptomyces sp. NPDC001288]|uniref:DUF4232 domain-containing protein n=1 Tax=Streptomyces sp. NPDC001297 TaxID=3364559 RepID=UPI0036CD7878